MGKKRAGKKEAKAAEKNTKNSAHEAPQAGEEDAETEALMGGYIEANQKAEEADKLNGLIGDEAAASGEEASYGDHLVELMSVETNIKKVHSGLKIPETVAAYIMAALYIILGCVFIIFPTELEEVLAYVAGGVLLVASAVQFVMAVITKEYMRTNTNKTATSFIMMGLAIMIICLPDWGHTLVITVWGIFGLLEGARAFNHALARISRGMRCSYYIVKGVVELTIAFLLLYDSNRYGELHIIVFGISLILDGLTVLPLWKKLFDR